MPGDLGRHLNLRDVFERLRGAVRLDPAQERDAFVEGELAVAGAVGHGVVEPINVATAEPVDAVANFHPDIAGAGRTQHLLERGNIGAARGDRLGDQLAAALQLAVRGQVVEDVQCEYGALHAAH